jgi:hypothetical protein
MKFPVIALVLLLLLEVPALYGVATSQAQPTTQSVTQPLYNYSDATSFSYAATILPNPLYNGTTLLPGQGTIFLPIVRSLELSYDFSLELSEPSSVIARAGWTTSLDGGLWNRTLNFSGLGPAVTTSSVSSFSISQNTTLNVSSVLGLIHSIANVTGYNPSSVILEFHPIVYLEMEPAGQSPLSVLYSPQFNMTIGSNAIIPGPAAAASGGSRSSTFVAEVNGVTGQRELAILAATVIGIGAIVAAFLTTRQAIVDHRRHVVARTLRQMTAPYQEAIAMTGTPPSNEKMVALGTWEGLVRVADMLGKPILRYEQRAADGEWRYFFYVLDGETQYTYLLPRAARLLAQDAEPASHRAG